MGSEHYPPARRLDVTEDIHGRSVADPYRWLEDADAPETKGWAAAQDELWRRYAGGLPARLPLRARLLDLIPGYVGPPHVVGGRRFWTARDRGQDHAVLYVTDDAGTRVLVDPNALSEDGTTVLDEWSPSWEGDRLAFQLSTGGDEESRLRVLDVATGEVIDGPVDRVRYSPVAWLPGGRELLYVRRLPPERAPQGETQFHRRVYRHRIGGGAGDPVDADRELFGDGSDRTTYFGVRTSADGAWVAVTASLGTAPRNDLYVRHLAAEDGDGGPWLPLLEGTDAQANPHFDRRGQLWILTNLDAPRSRLCRLTPSQSGELGPGAWEEVVASDPAGAVLEDYVLAGERLVVLWRRHALSEVTIHDRSTGVVVRTVALPGVGSADLTGRSDEGADAWVGYTDHTTPYRVFSLDLTTGVMTPELPPPTASGSAASGIFERFGTGRESDLDSRDDVSAGMTSTQIVAVSADGTPIHLDVVAPAATPDHPRPTVLYGYGGFDVSLTPTYSSSIRAWVEAGGVWVVAHLRGGAEEGEEWHRDGIREHKHHVFEDFEAAADTLVAAGWTTPDRLGIFGGSNGGLLVGAALTRSPERYVAVVCSAPLLDMVRYERFGLGATWNDEYGTAAEPAEFTWLLDMSPYHHVDEGTRYPAVLFTVFDSDTRVDPLHARKLAAALQWATTSDPRSRPILFRAEGQVGHGARSVTRTVELAADELAFFGEELGLDALGAR